MTTVQITLADALNDTRARAANQSGPARKQQQRLEQLGRLPKATQRAVMQVLDSMLAQADHRHRTPTTRAHP